MLFFSERDKLNELYKQWIKENKIVTNTSFNVIAFLEMKDLFNEQKVEEFLKENKVGDIE